MHVPPNQDPPIQENPNDVDPGLIQEIPNDTTLINLDQEPTSEDQGHNSERKGVDSAEDIASAEATTEARNSEKYQLRNQLKDQNHEKPPEDFNCPWLHRPSGDASPVPDKSKQKIHL